MPQGDDSEPERPPASTEPKPAGRLRGNAIGPLGAYNFLGGILGLGIIVLYILMNIGLVGYFWRRHRDKWSVVRHGILPVVGSLLMLLPIYGQVYPLPAWPYRLVPYLIVTWVVAGAVYFAVLRRRRPQFLDAMGRVWEPAADSGEPPTAREAEHAGRQAEHAGR